MSERTEITFNLKDEWSEEYKDYFIKHMTLYAQYLALEIFADNLNIEDAKLKNERGWERLRQKWEAAGMCRKVNE